MNMFDYCKWRGDLSFQADPFNEVDNLLFAQIAYIDFDEILLPDKSMTVAEAAEALIRLNPAAETGEGRSVQAYSQLLLFHMARTNRFASCRIYNYLSILHRKSSEQFAAFMVDLPDRTTAVCFRGTDETLIGWKEDLMLSYRDIQGQYDALDYFERRASIMKRYRLIGHSKGGYLALYVAINCKRLLQERIMEIYSDDGPGLMPGTYDEASFERIRDRYWLIVPEKDGIGTIYEMSEKKIIADIADVNIIAAHGMKTWQVMGNRIQRSDVSHLRTDQSRKMILQFLNETTPEQREIFVKEFFKSLDEAGITTLTQFSQGGLPIIFKVLKELSEMDGEAKKTANKLFQSFSSVWGSSIQKSLADKKDQIKDSLGSIIKKKEDGSSAKE